MDTHGDTGAETGGAMVRREWVEGLVRVVGPVLRAGGEGRLREVMPVEEREGAGRKRWSRMEGVARCLAGVGPWIELGEEGEARQWGELAVRTVVNAFDRSSGDWLDWSGGGQAIVEGAFLCEAFLRSPKVLWGGLDKGTQGRVVEAMKGLREHKPGFNNWLLFAAVVEAFLKKVGEKADPMRVDYALRQHEQWYVGGGWYKDGPGFHHDYYNSLVIQPMLLEVGEVFAGSDGWVAGMMPEWRKRAGRHAEILERMIAPDGSYPIVGRSMAYRCGVFHLLAWMAWRGELPEGLNRGQVRRGLTAVMRRSLGGDGVFDEKGWLRIGLSGHQPGIGEGYISTGSLYLCSALFLPLGLGAGDGFWTEWEGKTTWEKGWGGEDLEADHD